MRLDDDTYEFIKEEAIDIYVRYDIHSIPISGFEIAIKMGIILIPYSSLSDKKLDAAKRISPDGFYMEANDGKEYIYYEDQIGYERCNMTILHEIGHAVLGHSEDTDPIIAEAEASFFAKYMIAPPPLIYNRHINCPEEIEAVFGTSYEASWLIWIYYCNWERFHAAYGRFTEYEGRLNKLYNISA